MKKLAVILGIYIFGLSVMPCTDVVVHHDDIGATELAIDSAHYELCSPFCSDHECHTHITIDFASNELVQKQFCEIINVEMPAAIPTPLFAIWQPPKIA